MSSKPHDFLTEFPKSSEAEWKDLVEKALKGRDFDRVMQKKSYNDFFIQGLYSSKQEAIHHGGENKREVHQPVSSSQNWSICAPHWNEDAKASSKAIIDDLVGGASAIGLRFKSGYFPGIDPKDLKQLLKDVYLDYIHVNLLPGEDFIQTSTQYLSYVTAHYDLSKLKGNLGCDPIGTLAQTGRLSQTVEAALEGAANLSKVCIDKTPGISCFSVSTTAYHTAGASEKQELALMLSTGLEYLKAMEEAGVDIEKAAGQIQFMIVADADIYMTIAKMRAARRLWGEVLAYCGLPNAPMRLSAMSAVRMVSVRDPWVNILRSTAACFAASLGGADEITILPHDTMIGMPSDFARRIARNVQVILQEESGLGQVVDPAAGSFAFETLTSDLVKAAWSEFQHMQSTGGIMHGLQIGSIQASLEDNWLEMRKDISKRKLPITGVSEFPNLFEDPIDTAGPQPSFVPDAVEAAVEINPVVFHRLAEDFETLRDQSDRYTAEEGKRPSIFLANIGPVADHTARATYAKNYFEAGGIKALGNDGYTDIEKMVAAYKKTGSRAVVLCGSDKAYDLGAMDMVKAFYQAGADLIYIAGKRKEEAVLKEAGLTDCIYMGSDVLTILSLALNELMQNVQGEGHE
ncbi:methylmalonyl-CoA mutase subunit beta [Temperatibacter marinus]|uniref:Methylmalonyl-CoA mutase subunit beta n=1 Tax=Temperatibacter marinus TaxID=1456591 RepID=A0AA52EHF6_9PROT|nr:methylmalonyl-CoA mutase subunit beta [Temperatibacter marinus]WND02126.1 methylmalonyl-CoA mutase subunit beta [Temperatibacter marinus]